MMAKLIPKSLCDCKLECYSERGILSYFFFRYLTKRVNFQKFLKYIFPQKFYDFEVQEFSIFSELDLGNQGFGKPDGGFFFKINDQNHFVFFEGKFNESFIKSSRGKVYNSSARGQIELKMRLVACVFSSPKNFEKKWVSENDEIKKHYEKTDCFYKNRKDEFRRLNLKGGVQRLFCDYFFKCQKANIYFLIATKDNEDPFVDLPENVQPSFPNQTWEEIKKQLLWVSADYIENLNE